MALTKYTASTAIIAALSDLPNATDGLTPAQLKAKFDENPEAFKAFINNLINELEATTDGSSGADNIGATTISGLTGNDVQTLLEALKTLVDTKSNSTDIYTRTALNNGQLDTRYFTETELNSTTDNNSGADKIGATPISTSPSTVQGILEWLKQQIDNTTLGQIPDGSITDAKLSDEATDIKARFSIHETDNSNPHNVTASQVGAIPAAEKGAANGVATLGTDGLVPSVQLPPMEQVWEKIADVTLTSDTAQVDFANLGLENYKLLRVLGSNIRHNSTTTGTIDLEMRFNDDTSSSYNFRSCGAGAANVSSAMVLKMSEDVLSKIGTFDITIVNLLNQYKQAIGNSNYAENSADTCFLLWKSNSLINKISLFSEYSPKPIKTGATFTILGVK